MIVTFSNTSLIEGGVAARPGEALMPNINSGSFSRTSSCLICPLRWAADSGCGGLAPPPASSPGSRAPARRDKKAVRLLEKCFWMLLMWSRQVALDWTDGFFFCWPWLAHSERFSFEWKQIFRHHSRFYMQLCEYSNYSNIMPRLCRRRSFSPASFQIRSWSCFCCVPSTQLCSSRCSLCATADSAAHKPCSRRPTWW